MPNRRRIVFFLPFADTNHAGYERGARSKDDPKQQLGVIIPAGFSHGIQADLLLVRSKVDLHGGDNPIKFSSSSQFLRLAVSQLQVCWRLLGGSESFELHFVGLAFLVAFVFYTLYSCHDFRLEIILYLSAALCGT